MNPSDVLHLFAPYLGYLHWKKFFCDCSRRALTNAAWMQFELQVEISPSITWMVSQTASLEDISINKSDSP